jgi:hypothetical protein
VSAYGAWAGPDVNDTKNELDVWVTGDDGKVYHWWFRPFGTEWGFEVFG